MPVLSQVVLQELSLGRERERELRAVWHLAGARLLRSSYDREAMELRFGRGLTEREILEPHRRLAYVLAPEFAETSAQLPRAHEEYRAEEREKYRSTIEGMSAAQRRRILDSEEGRVALAITWAFDDVVKYAQENHCEHLLVPVPRVTRLPTFFAFKVVHVERLRLVLLNSASYLEPGVVDVEILVDALSCRRCELVTHEERLVVLSEAVRSYFPRFAVRHAREWWDALAS